MPIDLSNTYGIRQSYRTPYVGQSNRGLRSQLSQLAILSTSALLYTCARRITIVFSIAAVAIAFYRAAPPRQA